MNVYRTTSISGSASHRRVVPLYFSNETPVLFWLAAASAYGIAEFVEMLSGAPRLSGELLTLGMIVWAASTTLKVYRGLGYGLVTQFIATAPAAGILLWVVTGNGSEGIAVLAMLATLGIIAMSGSRFSESQSNFQTSESSGVSPSEELDTPGLVDKHTGYDVTFYDNGGSAPRSAVHVGMAEGVAMTLVGMACAVIFAICVISVWTGTADFLDNPGVAFSALFFPLFGVGCVIRGGDVTRRLRQRR